MLDAHVMQYGENWKTYGKTTPRQESSSDHKTASTILDSAAWNSMCPISVLLNEIQIINFIRQCHIDTLMSFGQRQK
jgi:hypothetical protein